MPNQETGIKDFNPHIQGLILDSIENAVSMINDMCRELPNAERGDSKTVEAVEEQTITFLAIALDPAMANPAVVPDTIKKVAKSIVRANVYVDLKFDRPE